MVLRRQSLSQEQMSVALVKAVELSQVPVKPLVEHVVELDSKLFVKVLS